MNKAHISLKTCFIKVLNSKFQFTLKCLFFFMKIDHMSLKTYPIKDVVAICNLNQEIIWILVQMHICYFFARSCLKWCIDSVHEGNEPSNFAFALKIFINTCFSDILVLITKEISHLNLNLHRKQWKCLCHMFWMT